MEEDDAEDDDVKGEEDDDVENDDVEEEDDDVEEEDRSQDRNPRFVRACTNGLGHCTRATLCEKKGKRPQTKTAPHVLGQPAQSKCT